MKDVLITDFSGSLEAEGFLSWIQAQGAAVTCKDWRNLEGTNCYCDDAAKAAITAGLPGGLPALRWIDTGDYHYMSHLLALRETEPFHLVLLDHHPDNQEPAFGGVLSCGSWVKALQEENPLVKDVVSIGPDGCPSALPEGWAAARRGERVYVSLDKDILDRAYARTDWSQGDHTLAQVCGIISALIGPMKLAAIDICGGITPEKGGTPEDLRINKETDIALYQFLSGLY
jgi:hypothetical protein